MGLSIPELVSMPGPRFVLPQSDKRGGSQRARACVWRRRRIEEVNQPARLANGAQGTGGIQKDFTRQRSAQEKCRCDLSSSVATSPIEHGSEEKPGQDISLTQVAPTARPGALTDAESFARSSRSATVPQYLKPKSCAAAEHHLSTRPTNLSA